ncbi:MAG TPA: ATP-binding protein, partial [Chryseolinea sp.]|nr:ATP-binding protein [Chryseolinea sp.]
WRPASNLPGYAGRKGLSASIMVIDPITQKKYIVIFFVPFKRIMTNTVKVGYKKGDVFIFRTDSLYFNFDGTNDSANGFDTTKYFVPWKDISVKKHSEAIKTWQSLDGHDSLRIARFECDGVNYAAAFNSVIAGDDGTYYALVIPSASLPTLFRSKSGMLVLVAFILLLGIGIVFTIVYIKNFNKVRFIPLTAEAVKQMISFGESDLLEFKSTIRTNLRAGKPGKEIELAWLKSVVAFCNTEGGTILIGVNDSGEILGLEADGFQNDDKCLLHIQNLIGEHVGVEYLSYVRFRLLEMEDKKILAVQCIPLKRIMLLKWSGKEQFYVRSGPSSIELPMSKVLEYVSDRKKRF